MQFESPAGGVDDSSYVDPDPATGTDGSIVRAPAVENHQRELVYLIEQAGLTPDRADLTQVYQAIVALGAGGAGGGGAGQLLVNGGMAVWQDGTARTAASTYLNSNGLFMADQIILQSDGADVADVSRESSVVPITSQYAMLLDVETGSKKFGILTVLEAASTIPLRGQNVSMSFQARVAGSSIDALRAAVVVWNGTADAFTRAAVSAWGGAGTNPTLVSNWAFVGTPGALTAPTTSYQTYAVEAQAIPTDTTNVGVFIWIDTVTATVGDFLYLAELSLVRGNAAVAGYLNAPRAHETIQQCQRYYVKTSELDTAPANGIGQVGALQGKGESGTHEPGVSWRFPVSMRASPTVTLYNPRAGGTAGQWQFGPLGDSANARAFNPFAGGVVIDNAGTPLAGTPGQCFIHAKADARLGV